MKAPPTARYRRSRTRTKGGGQPETMIRNQICAFLALNGILAFLHDSVGIFDPVRKIYRANRSPYRRKGVSDVIGIIPGGRFLAVEVKTETGRASPEQRAFLEEVAACGGVGILARSIEDVIRGLDAAGVAIRNRLGRDAPGETESE